MHPPRTSRGRTLRRRILWLVATFAVLLVATTTAAVVAVDRAASSRSDIDSRLQPAIVNTRALLAALVDQETGERGFVITGNPSFLEPYHAGRHEAAARLGGLHAEFTDDPEVQADIHDLETAIEEWRVAGPAPEIQARTGGHARLARRLVAQGAGRTAFDRVRATNEALLASIEARTDEAEADAAGADRLLRDILVTNTVLLMVLALVMGVLLRRWVLAPVEALRSSMRQVAVGDLDSPVRVGGPAEVAAIGADAEAMRRRLVTELETSRAAVEGLEQQSPVVAGMRAELAAQPLTGFSGLSIAGVLRPVEGVLAGDWWQAIARPSGKVALVVADVSGHGAAAGLVALRFKQRISALLQADLDLLRAFDIATADLERDPERFVSCIVAEVDPDARTLHWINAGHPPCLLVRREDGEIRTRELAPTGPIVSALGGSWEVAETPVDPDDLLVALTDGVLEARSADGQEFGLEGVLAVIGALPDWSPGTAVAEMDAAVRSFAGGVRHDDMTAVAALLGR